MKPKKREDRSVQNLVVHEETPEFCILSDESGLFVEAWAAWHLPFMNLTSEQRRYREVLRNAIRGLSAADGVCKTYASSKVTRNLDTENVLFYNVGAAPFRHVAKQNLRFERKQALPPLSRSLKFEPQHFVKYEAETKARPFHHVQGEMLAACPPVMLGARSEIRNLPRLWWTFKHAVVKEAGLSLSPGEQFAVQICLSAPYQAQLNLSDIVKPLMDGFISALHHYEGRQLDDVALRVAARLETSVEAVRNLLVDDRSAILGARSVPHLFGEGLQWSPADHLLVGGEVLRNTVPDGHPVQVSGALFRTGSKLHLG